MNISNGLQYHQQDKKKAKQNINTNTELQFEIECPRLKIYVLTLIAYTISAKNVTFVFIYKRNKILKLILLGYLDVAIS